MPLPKGVFHVFNKKGNGAFFVGESSINKTVTLGQKATVNIGTALDVYANAKQIERKEISDEKSEYTYRMEIRNISKENKKITVEQDLHDSLTFKESSLKPTENLPHRVTWTLDIPANAIKTYSFTIQYTDLDLVRRKRETELAKEKLAAEEARLEAEREYQRLKLKH